jgi:hypothetical protein
MAQRGRDRSAVRRLIAMLVKLAWSAIARGLDQDAADRRRRSSSAAQIMA